MICVPSYLSVFVQKILDNKQFLSFHDGNAKEWLCVFDFVGETNLDFFRGIFQEFGISSEKIHVMEADAMFQGTFETKEEYDRSVARDSEIRDFVMIGATDLERVALEDAISFSCVNSLYMLREDFEIAKENVSNEFDGEDIEYLRLSFDSQYSLLIKNNIVCEIPQFKGTNPPLEFLLSKYFFSNDNHLSEDWDALYYEWFGVQEDSVKSPRKSMKDAVDRINEKSIKAFGFKCLDFKANKIKNVVIQ